MQMFIDSFLVYNKMTRSYRSRFKIFMDTAFTSCFSMKQSTVEISVFGAEFVARKKGIDYVRSIRFVDDNNTQSSTMLQSQSYH